MEFIPRVMCMNPDMQKPTALSHALQLQANPLDACVSTRVQDLKHAVAHVTQGVTTCTPLACLPDPLPPAASLHVPHVQLAGRTGRRAALLGCLLSVAALHRFCCRPSNEWEPAAVSDHHWLKFSCPVSCPAVPAAPAACIFIYLVSCLHLPG
jgi:hypothetical protein